MQSHDEILSDSNRCRNWRSTSKLHPINLCYLFLGEFSLIFSAIPRLLRPLCKNGPRRTTRRAPLRDLANNKLSCDQKGLYIFFFFPTSFLGQTGFDQQKWLTPDSKWIYQERPQFNVRRSHGLGAPAWYPIQAELGDFRSKMKHLGYSSSIKMGYLGDPWYHMVPMVQQMVNRKSFFLGIEWAMSFVN